MKKYILLFIAVILLSGCVKAGDFDLFPIRKKIIDAIRGYSIDDLEKENYTGTTNERDNNIILNKALTVRKGDALLRDKYYNKSHYQQKIFMPNKKGNIQGFVYTMNLDPKETYEVNQTVKINGKKYYLLPSGIEDYYYLFDEDGLFYEYAGVKKDNRLNIIDTEEILPYPADLKMNTVIKNREEVSDVLGGFEVKYGGAELDRIWFDYMEYDGSDSHGTYERINFPNKPGLIMINGRGLRIIRADDNYVTYMILKNE